MMMCSLFPISLLFLYLFAVFCVMPMQLSFFNYRSLHREIPLTNSCAVISHLFSAKYFFVFAFVAFVALIGTGLLILTCDQCYNIAANLVSGVFCSFVAHN